MRTALRPSWDSPILSTLARTFRDSLSGASDSTVSPHASTSLAKSSGWSTLEAPRTTRRSPGMREFDVWLNGKRVLESFDAMSEVGFANPCPREFDVTVDDGMLELTLEIEESERHHSSTGSQIAAIEIKAVRP